jgi:hypothetical protein
MQTVLIFDRIIEPLCFIVAEGDLRHLDRVYINEYNAEDPKNELLQNELSEFLHDEKGNDRHTLLDTFPVDAVKDGAVVIVVGFLP